MSIGAKRDRLPHQLGGPAWKGPAPAMTRHFHLPADGITALDRLNALASGVHVSTPRPHCTPANDNRIPDDGE